MARLQRLRKSAGAPLGHHQRRRLLVALLVGLIAAGTGCEGASFCFPGGSGGGCEPGGGGPLPDRDCLPPPGTRLCGPPWDSDNDTISTSTEQNTANAEAYGGFYTSTYLLHQRVGIGLTGDVAVTYIRSKYRSSNPQPSKGTTWSYSVSGPNLRFVATLFF